MKRLYAIDLDGTLLTNNKSLPPEAKICFSKIQSSGDIVLFMTGRSYAQTKDYIHALKVDGIVICNDGRYILKSNGMIIDKCASLDYWDARTVLNVLNGICYVLAFRDETEYMISSNLLSKVIFTYKRLIQKKKIELVNSSRKSSIVQDIDKFIVCSMNRNGLFDYLNKTLGKQYNIYNLQDEGKIQISGREANKLVALRKVQQMLNVADECVYVFGNDGNDTQVLGYYQNSFAVSNACDSIKNVAKEIIGSNENGGVIKKLNELRG